MQVYVHLAGKNHGPYSIDQLRQYVKAGNFRYDQLACYDGTNWVKIKDVPGLMVQAKKPKPAPQKAQQKVRIFIQNQVMKCRDIEVVGMLLV